jgi:hypothetical protein
MNKLAIVLLISIGLISCQENKRFLTDDFSYIENYSLIELTTYPVDSIGNPDFIFSYDDYIILAEPRLDYLISSYNTTTGVFKRFLKKGNGPNELLDIQQLNAYKNDTTFFIKSTFGKDIFLCVISDTLILNKIQIPDNSISLYFDGGWVISSQYGEKRFSLYYDESKSPVEFGDSIVLDNCPQEIVSHVLMGLCTGNVNLKRFVWASFYGDIFEIYDYRGNSVKLVSGIKRTLPIVSVERNQPVFSVDSKLGVVSITATDEHIYMLYNENLIKDYSTKKQNIMLSTKVLVYDWDGHPVKIINLDKPLRSISYNKKHNVIYCLGFDSNDGGKIFYMERLIAANKRKTDQ